MQNHLETLDEICRIWFASNKKCNHWISHQYCSKMHHTLCKIRQSCDKSPPNMSKLPLLHLWCFQWLFEWLNIVTEVCFTVQLSSLMFSRIAYQHRRALICCFLLLLFHVGCETNCDTFVRMKHGEISCFIFADLEEKKESWHKWEMHFGLSKM